MAKAFLVSDVEGRGTAYVKDKRFTLHVAIKVNPLLGLCTAAAALEFSPNAQLVLSSFGADVLYDLLRSDDLAIAREEELLDALVSFAGSDACASSDGLEKLERLLPTLRLEDIDLLRLLDTVNLSSVLRRSA